MSTQNRTSLYIHVVDVDRRLLGSASVLSPGMQAKPMSGGRFVFDNLPPGRVQLRVEAKGFSPVDLWVEVSGEKKYVDVVLGEAGMPSFRRKNVPVPFRSPGDKLGVITRGEEGAAAVDAYLREHQLKSERPHGRDLVIVTCDPTQSARIAADLRRLPEVREVGRLVNPSARGTGILTRNINVQARPGTDEKQLAAVAEKAGCTVARKLILKDHWILTLKEGEDFSVLDAALMLEADSHITAAEPDIAFTADPDAITPTDQLYASQWHLGRVNAPDAWQTLRDTNAAGVNPGDPNDLTFGSANILLAVMDTGVKSVTLGGVVSAEHPEFQGNVTSGQPKVTGFFDFGGMVANCNDPIAVFGDGYHGSACAGVAAARVDNASAVAGEDEGGSGAAPNCRILAVQGSNPCTEAQYSDMYLWLAGFDPGNPDPAFPAQLAHGADVVTNSWGGYNPAVWPISTLMDDLFTNLTDNGRGGLGTLMFFSAGNAGQPNFWTQRPFAAHPRNFGVAASTDADVKADYSNWGDGVDLCAPSSGGAVDITTTTIPGKGTLAGHTGGALDYISNFGGTSSATPLTAGVASLLLSMDPTLTHEEARAVLTRTAKRIDYSNSDTDGHWRDLDGDGINEYSWWYGFGMVDAARAVCVARNTLSVDPAVVFVDVPEHEQAIRPVVIRLKGWRPRTFSATVPVTTSGPANSFVLHAGAMTSYAGSFDCAETHVYIWLRYTGTVAGDLATGNVTVTCNETAQAFVINLTANTIHRPKTALVLSLDRSGSMNDPAGDGRLKIDLVRDSAFVVPTLCDAGTGLGAVSWDTDADVAGAMTVEGAGVESTGAGRVALNTFITNHHTNVLGTTAIGDGVEAGQTLLNASVGYDLRALCLLTDGNETASKYIADLTAMELHSRIFAIGVGTPENINPTSLSTLTSSNSGYLLMTGNIDADDTFLLTKYFQQILAGVTNTEIVVDPQGWLTPGTSLRLPFPVNETDWQVDAIVHCQVADLLRFHMEAPDGQTFGPAQAIAPSTHYVVGQGSAYYRMDVPSPIVGPQDPARPWHVVLELDEKGWVRYIRDLREKKSQVALGRAIHGLRYAFTAQARSSLRMDVSVSQSSREPGSTAWLRATLLEYGYPLSIPAKVWAVVTDPRGAVLNVPLTSTGAGNYQGSLVADFTGAWRITILAEGKTSKGSPFLREALRSVAVWPGGNRPGPHSPAESPLDKLLHCICAGGVVNQDAAKKLGVDLKRLCECVKKTTPV
ncbi:S8 family serine peptidase [Edaphobacter modestus]|uniref:Subtilase family protein n=1 Tax=Edaphobacter modestus TaxID=388466 RepID=A0A4Q7YTL6_9BACT|nr:S8 family serine peptidase [Edaphobacter modestus]RZU40343.1 subtilase family protein [Edaphobacter modestus]